MNLPLVCELKDCRETTPQTVRDIFYSTSGEGVYTCLFCKRVGLAITGTKGVHNGFHRQALQNSLKRVGTKLQLENGAAT